MGHVPRPRAVDQRWDVLPGPKERPVRSAGHAVVRRLLTGELAVHLGCHAGDRFVLVHVHYRTVLDELDVRLEALVLSGQAGQDGPQLLPQGLVVLLGHGADIQIGHGLPGHDVQLSRAAGRRGLDHREGNRGQPEERILAAAALLRGFELLEGQDDSGQAGVGVDAGERHGAMGHLPVDPDDCPHRPLHAQAKLVLLRLADQRRVHVVGMAPLDEVLDADHHPFFVAYDAQADLAPKRGSALEDRLRRHQVHGKARLHVARTPAVQLPVVDLAAEGVVAPGAALALGHHVGVPFEHQALPGSARVQGGDHVLPPRLHFFDQRLHSQLPLDPAGHKGHGLTLGVSGFRADDAVDAHEVPGQLHQFLLVDEL